MKHSHSGFTKNDYCFAWIQSGVRSEKGPGLLAHVRYTVHTLALSCMPGSLSTPRHSGCCSPPSLSRRRDLHAVLHPSVRWWHSLSCILFKNSRDPSLVLYPRASPLIPKILFFISSITEHEHSENCRSFGVWKWLQHEFCGVRLQDFSASSQHIGRPSAMAAEPVSHGKQLQWPTVTRPGVNSALGLHWSFLNAIADHIHHTWKTVCQNIIFIRIY